MSHGIMEVDKGVVWGTTWHRLPQYQTQEGPVTFEQAEEVLNFPLSKEPLYRSVGRIAGEAFEEARVPGAYCIVRSDTGTVMVPMVGSGFQIIQNVKLLETVQRNVLEPCPSLDIESVGTLWGGATQFVSIKINEFAVKGDDSPTVSRLMFYNPLGKGSYKVVAHDIRVVCSNTINAAAGSAQSTVKVRHTRSAGQRISNALVDMAKVFADFEAQVELYEFMAQEPMSQEDVDHFLAIYIPIPELRDEDSTRSKTLAENKRVDLMTQFQVGDPALSNKIKHTKYGMLQAVTYVLDHEEETPTRDRASLIWDGITGGRAARKTEALSLLTV